MVDNRRVKGIPKWGSIEQEWVACACGCGTLIERYYNYNGHWHERRYQRNHHAKHRPTSEKQKATSRQVAQTAEWRNAHAAGTARRNANPAWQASVTSDAMKEKWDRRGRATTYTTQCFQCGATVERPLYRRKHGPREFCNRTCQDQFLRGEQHPNYSGGFKLYPHEFSAPLRRLIRQRDCHTCQRCGVVQSGLCVHHIDTDKTHNHPSNLISLCRSCHMTVHGEIRRTGQIVRFAMEGGA